MYYSGTPFIHTLCIRTCICHSEPRSAWTPVDRRYEFERKTLPHAPPPYLSILFPTLLHLSDFHDIEMAPSASKQKRLAEKAAKAASRAPNSTSTSTPTTSVNGGSATNTPLTSLSAAQSREDLTSMAKLQIATDR